MKVFDFLHDEKTKIFNRHKKELIHKVQKWALEMGKNLNAEIESIVKPFTYEMSNEVIALDVHSIPDHTKRIAEKILEYPPEMGAYLAIASFGRFLLRNRLHRAPLGNLMLTFESMFTINFQRADQAAELLTRALCMTDSREIAFSIYKSMTDPKMKLLVQNKLLKINQEIGELVCYGDPGDDYYDPGDVKKAIKNYKELLKTAKKVKDKITESGCYAYLGDAFYNLGDSKKAIDYYEKSLEIAKEIRDRNKESGCYTGLGLAYHSLGSFEKALRYYEKSLETAKEIGNKPTESGCYGNIANIHCDLGNYRNAIENYEKLLKIAQESGDRATESRYYINLGAAYGRLKDFRKAIEYTEKSLEIKKEIGDKKGESKCYVNLGIDYCSLRNFNKAIKYLEKSLKIVEKIGNRGAKSRCYSSLGIIYSNLGDLNKAIKYHNKSLELAKGIGNIDLEMSIILDLAEFYYRSEPELAYDYFKQAIDLSEMISGTLVEEEHEIGFYAQAFDVYQLMIPLCVKIKKEKEAFEYIERSKSRAFLDLLATTEINPAIEVTSELKSLLDSEEKYLAKLRQIQMQHLRQTKIPVEPGEVEHIHERLTQTYKKIERFDPEYVFIRRGKPLSLNDLQGILSSQKKDTVLIEYFITENKTFIFVISSRDSNPHVKTVPLTSETFNQYLQDWRKIALSLDIRAISHYLVEPISEYITEGDLLYFVPYGPLHYFPLHALTLDDEPLIKSHPVAYLPSASILPFCKNKGTGTLKTCTSFGVMFEKEAEKIAELFNTNAYTGSSVTAKNLGTCNTDIIHLSCHGLFDDKDPLSSRIQLHDRTLTARDIFDMRLTTELVTLSACETGYNETSPGDELIGLTRAFLYAGAPSVIVSLWPVYGRSTEELMLEFYTQLKSGTDKATALQKAQIKMMEKKRYSPLFHWAPFILIGNWK